MASVYILHSNKLNRFYIGNCNDLSYRLDQHVNKEFIKSFTAKTDDWILYFSIDDLIYQQARLIESHIKRMRSKVYIENLKKHPEIIEKLRSKYCKAGPDSYRGRRWVQSLDRNIRALLFMVR